MDTKKRLVPRLAAIALAFAVSTAVAAPPPAAQEAAAKSLPAWEQLSPEQRELLIGPLRERWNAAPGERVRMLEHARRWRDLPPDERERARRGARRFEQMSPEQRDRARAIFHQTRGMSEEQRRDFMQRWERMTPAQRSEWLRTHPAPAHP
ncbi:DUF3106 domain-containing protein [Pseudoxanthomonas sp.]|uniref:DUF3106 domain-containing protein n=1 Tax=Pseudoxanthomonas sp. TaxID=1871049 RepID=UPI00258FED93|nr:DUF3106 domain-containing protein [Pseudoxanthomonas sp.]MCR6686266.1 DUF3106 domain-containing protein [Pseudoxanthomonas sp.]